MTLATKNGSLILKDDALAENCGCCNDACAAKYTKLRITFNNLPAECWRSNNRFVTRDLPTLNGCSFAAFRQSAFGGTQYCTYYAQIPGLTNFEFNCGRDSLYVTIDFDKDTIRIVSSVAGIVDEIVLVPQAGKRFRSLPYSGSILVQFVRHGSGCNAAQWSGVTVSIDADDPQLIPISCPPHSTYCVQDADTAPNPPDGYYSEDIATCTACDPERIARTPSAGYLPASILGVVSQVPELNVSLSIGNVAVQQSPAGWPSNRLFPQSINGFQSMSGTYALKYRANATAYATLTHALINDDYTVDGELVNHYSSGCGWAGEFFSTDYGQPDTGKGYEFRLIQNQIETDYRALAAMRIAVVPIGWHMPYSTSEKQYNKAPCSGDTVAYQVRIRFYWQFPSLSDSGFGYYRAVEPYWSADAFFYGSVPCQARGCRTTPEFSVSGRVNCTPTIVSFSQLWQANSKFDVSVSTQ